MKTKAWLKVDRRGVNGVTRNRPGLRSDEIAIVLELEIPDSYFQRPTITAKVEVGEDRAVDNVVAETVTVLGELVEQAGLQVRITAGES